MHSAKVINLLSHSAMFLLLNRDEEDARLFPSNGAVSAEIEIFTLTPTSGNLTIGSQIKKN
jgi:hypothetical protein